MDIPFERIFFAEFTFLELAVGFQNRGVPVFDSDSQCFGLHIHLRIKLRPLGRGGVTMLYGHGIFSSLLVS